MTLHFVCSTLAIPQITMHSEWGHVVGLSSVRLSSTGYAIIIGFLLLHSVVSSLSPPIYWSSFNVGDESIDRLFTLFVVDYRISIFGGTHGITLDRSRFPSCLLEFLTACGHISVANCLVYGVNVPSYQWNSQTNHVSYSQWSSDHQLNVTKVKESQFWRLSEW